MKQVTMVAWYGGKPDGMLNLIEEIQDYLAEKLGSRFEKYVKEQIHATVIGMERTPEGKGKWYQKNRKKDRDVQFKSVEELREEHKQLDLEVQFAGFKKCECYGFLSRKKHPYERSFSIMGDGCVMIIGWPRKPKGEGIDTKVIDRLRHRFNPYGLLHQHHKERDDVDNDVYLRLGKVERIDSILRSEIEGHVRDYLSAIKPVVEVSVKYSDIKVALYTDETLPLGTKVIKLDEVDWSKIEEQAR